MIRTFTERKRFRKNFGRIREVAHLPNLIELQKTSYENFLQINVPSEKREKFGLQEVFCNSFPVKDFAGKAQVDFHKYYFDEPKYTEDECRQRGLTFAASLRAVFRLIVWDIDEVTGGRSIRDIKEQDVYIVDLPLMTRNGTFIVNGIERVVVSQMQRSPGVFFDHDSGKTHSSGKYLFSAHVIPSQGSWLDIEFDAKDHLYVRIDRRRKILATTFLMALDSKETEDLRESAPDREFGFTEISGMGREEILAHFYASYDVEALQGGLWKRKYNSSDWLGVKLEFDLVDAASGEILVESGKKINSRTLKEIDSKNVKEILLTDEGLVGKYSAVDVIDVSNGIIIAEAGDELTDELLEKIRSVGSPLSVLVIDHVEIGGYVRSTLAVDKCNTREEALFDIYRVLRPGEPPTLDGAQNLFNGLFFDPARYDLSVVGRVKMNERLGLDIPEVVRTLMKKDIICMIKILHDLKDGRGNIDDIDNLGNRRIRSVGELLENQFAVGFSRMDRAIRERMSSVDIENAVPNDVINAKPVASTIREFFGLSQLSQFMDQTNPLAEVTHKRRLSALGPGGLSRERAGLDVRDVHTTHYGRICPIETPEGQNIGLISSLATFARVNKYGFIEAPYRKVIDNKVTDDVLYLSAMEESKYTIAQANSNLSDDGRFVDEFVNCRRNGEFINAHRDSIDFMDISPKQIVSVAASLIPFLEKDDASRALMGSNMQRQAVPLLRAQAPLVGTGMEGVVARDSGAAICARRSGIVDQVDASRIVITAMNAGTIVGVDIYNLRKFERSNQSTCLNQKPLVNKGDIIEAGDIIADGSGTELGELSLGQNALVGFMSWNGYGFEDAIVISERLVREDYFTSIHIEEFEILARDTKLGSEEITRDIPNVSDENLVNLDETGIIHVGAEVHPGDILVGKVTPKGESPMTPEEKLLMAIFREKASDVKDSSLRLPPGCHGTVVDVKIFSRRSIEKDERAIAIERREIDAIQKDHNSERAIIDRTYYNRLADLLKGQEIISSPVKSTSIVVTDAVLSSMNRGQWRLISVKDTDVNNAIRNLSDEYEDNVNKLKKLLESKIEKIRMGDDLAPGILKMVKVYIAEKRKLQPGDKLAGRHGNKGVVSKIVPVEDMPYLEDGTPLDIVLNPLGLPSRMNIGQIIETNLGWVSLGLGAKIRQVIENVQADSDLIAKLKSEMSDIYGEADRLDIESLSDYQVVELATNITKGVPVSTHVFDGATEQDIVDNLQKCGLDSSGQVTLIDGLTGNRFERKVTVGCIYMLKLDHMVDDKIHARSIGPYSLVTQQPLGGKAQFGGQRFGEMEVWALQAYGAAYTLQEMLTIKSDDVVGRTKAYESIIRGDENISPGIPESFNVLTKELCALGLNFEFHQNQVKNLDKSDV